MTSVKQTVTLLHRALLLLLKDSLNFSSRLQVVGAVCITVDDDSSDLVIKFNDILQRDELNTPLNLAQHGTGGLAGGGGAQNGQGAGSKLNVQHGGGQGKRKAGKGHTQRVNAAAKRSSALTNEGAESEVEEEETQAAQAEVGVSSQSEAASSVDDPSYIACAARSADSSSKKRKVSTSGTGARCSLGTVPVNRGASASASSSAKRKGGSNGSAADYKMDGGMGGDECGDAAKKVEHSRHNELKVGANGRGAARQSGWAASSRKRSPCSCQVCGMVFCSRAVLERHALRHFGVRPYECTVCSERFYRKDQALTHVKKAHDGCTPAESYVAEKVGKTESRQLIEQLAHANANPGAGALLGAPDDSMEDADADAEDHKPDMSLNARMRTPVGVGGLPTFVSAMPPSGVNSNVRFDGTSMMTDSDADDDDDAGVAKNDDELEDDEEDADADNDQRNSPGITAGDPINASGESLSWLIQQKRTRGELMPRGAGSRSDHRTPLGVREALRKLANEDEDDEQRGRGGDDEPNEETDEDAAILRHHDEEALFGFGGAAMAIPGAIDNDDDDDGDAGASSAE